MTVLLAFTPVVAIAQVLPLSLNGLGIREGAFVLFLGPLGVAAGQAVAIGLIVYALTLAVSLLGAPAFAVGGLIYSFTVTWLVRELGPPGIAACGGVLLAVNSSPLRSREGESTARVARAARPRESRGRCPNRFSSASTTTTATRPSSTRWTHGCQPRPIRSR